MKNIISSPKAPAAIGPYSQATEYNGIIFVSGQLPINPATGALCEGDIKEQTRVALTNISNILEAAGSNLQKVLRTTVLLKDMGDFADVNEAYAEFFPAEPPARVCYQVAALPKNARIEIEVTCIQ